MQIKEHIPDVYQLMQKKLTEFNLMVQPGFVWCANVSAPAVYDVICVVYV